MIDENYTIDPATGLQVLTASFLTRRGYCCGSGCRNCPYQLRDLHLESERLLLREFSEADWSAVHVYGSDPEVCRHQHWGPNSEAETKAFVRMAVAQQDQDPRDHFELAILRKDTKKLIGAAGIRIKSRTNANADMGYTLRQDQWGQGFATEAARLLLNFGFLRLGLHRIWATAGPENRASIRVLEKIGMKFEGQLRQDLLVRGEFRDSLLYSVLRGDFQPTVSKS